MAVEYLDNGNDDGTVFGQDSTEYIAFYGATPIVRPSSFGDSYKISGSAGVTTDSAVLSKLYGEVTVICSNVNGILNALHKLGLIASV
jgi:hypothetical protein